MISNIDMAFLKTGDSIARAPGGYWCRILEVERPKRLKVRDPHIMRVFWLNWETVKTKWRCTPQSQPSGPVVK